MIRKIINQHLTEMAEDILELNDKHVKKFIKETKEEGVDEKQQVKFMETILSQVLIADEDEYQGALYQGIDNFVETMRMHSESYWFEVEMKDKEIVSTREIRVPGYFMLSDLVYGVLAAYDALGCEEFHIKYKQDVFKVDDEDFDALPAHMIPLGALKLRKNDKLEMMYDYEEKWEFVIRYKGKTKLNFIDNIPMLVQGEGYNIWEDEHEMLRILYRNPNELVVIEHGLEVPVHSCAEEEGITLFNDAQKEFFINEIMEHKTFYEDLDMSDLSDDDFDDEDFETEHVFPA